MHAFKDRDGREWLVEIHTTAIKRVRGLLSLDLLALTDDGFAGLGKLLDDPVALIDVLYVLCRDQAEARGVSDEDFGRSFSGDALGAAADAFLAEYADFFQDPRRRAGIRKLIAKSRQVTEILMDRVEADLDAIDLEAEVRAWIARSGGSPATSGSTPAPSPSASST